MAPFIGPGKKEVIHSLRHHKKCPLEITLGRYEPQFIIRHSEKENSYELLPLVRDEKEAEKTYQRGIAEGYFVPEMTWQSLVPGTPLIRDIDREAFILNLESWPGWADLQ